GAHEVGAEQHARVPRRQVGEDGDGDGAVAVVVVVAGGERIATVLRARTTGEDDRGGDDDGDAHARARMQRTRPTVIARRTRVHRDGAGRRVVEAIQRG